MTSSTGAERTDETATVRVRYWAAARSAAGVDGDDIAVEGPVSLADVVRAARELHPGTRLGDVLGICSVLIGDRPVGGQEPAEVTVQPGSQVEFLPPFAGG